MFSLLIASIGASKSKAEAQEEKEPGALNPCDEYQGIQKTTKSVSSNEPKETEPNKEECLHQDSDQDTQSNWNNEGENN